MTCWLLNEKNELLVNVVIEKFQSIELKNGEMWINGIIHFPTDDILEIKVKEGDD